MQHLKKGISNPSKAYTLAIKKYDGTISVSHLASIVYGEDEDTVTLVDLRNGDSMDVEWVALYEG